MRIYKCSYRTNISDFVMVTVAKNAIEATNIFNQQIKDGYIWDIQLLEIIPDELEEKECIH